MARVGVGLNVEVKLSVEVKVKRTFEVKLTIEVQGDFPIEDWATSKNEHIRHDSINYVVVSCEGCPWNMCYHMSAQRVIIWDEIGSVALSFPYLRALRGCSQC